MRGWTAGLSLIGVAVCGCALLVDTDLSSEGCPEGHKPCKNLGICVRLDNPEYGCAQDLCQPCVLFKATSFCSTEGTCAIGSCVSDWEDCDGLASTGCEENLATSHLHCGECGNECHVDNGLPACAIRKCAIRKCDVGFKDCDGLARTGCETNIKTAEEHCGACGDACDGGTCSDGVCQ